MARYKHVDREQGVMLSVSFENQIMPGTFEHTVDYLVENRTSTEIIDLRYKNDDTGAPDHSTIAKFISSLGKDIKDVFTDVLMVCEDLDLLGGTEFALDGCKMSSNASKEWE